jgi:hypothetical protein
MGSLANLKLLVGLVEAGVLPPVDLDPRQWVDGLSGLAILKEPSEQEIFQLKDFCRLVHDKQVTLRGSRPAHWNGGRQAGDGDAHAPEDSNPLVPVLLVGGKAVDACMLEPPASNLEHAGVPGL